MKKLMILVTLILVATLAFGQTWEVKKENLDVPVFMDAFFLDATTGWLVLEDNRIDMTTNGGVDWTTIKADDATGTDWEDIEFISADTGFVACDDGLIYTTTNGGTDWTQIGDTASYTEDLKGISVVDANTIYCAGKDTLVLKTVNGGASWTYQTNADGFEGQDLDGGIAFTDANNGVVITDANKGYTWYTSDGGTTWTFKEIASIFPVGTTSKRLYDVSAGGSTVVVVGYHNTIFLSTDGGANYALSGDFSYAYDRHSNVNVVDDNNIFVSGSDCHTVKTTDGGTTWDTLAVGTGQSAKSINFVDANNGYLFANYGQWFKTTDGGTNWIPLTEWPSISFWGLALPEDNKIVLTSWGGGEITTSTDGGANWTYPLNLTSGTSENLYECEFIDASNALIGGGYGYIARSTDGGATWTSIDNPMAQASNKHVNSIHYADANTVFAGGSSGYILVSTDGGQNWTELENEGSKTVYDIWPISSTSVIATGSSGQIYHSNASVDSFALMEDYGSMSMRAVEFRGDVGIIVASKGYIYTTSPTAVANGDSLVEVFVEPDGDDFYDVEFINDFLVYVVGEGGKIYKSVDAGENWTQETSPTTETLNKVRYRNGKLWAIGKSGTILVNNLGSATINTDLCINEFLASNDAAAQDEHGDYDDFVEIYNMGSDSINIGGMYITDDLSDPRSHWIPDTNSSATTIAGGEFLVIWCDKESEQGILHAEIKLSGSGEQVGLYQVIGDKADFIDSLTYGAQITDTSYGRFGDGTSTWVQMLPTPGATNTGEVAIREGIVGVPETFKVHQNYPNPFNPTTKIGFDLPKATDVTISIYNVLGQKVTTLVNSHFNAGFYNAHWNATNDLGQNVATGIYIYKVQTNENVSVKRMVYLK
ncbi:MAG: YCF48-related protein [Candidatus Marinimicrobia bacterium]|nr:YCF48-related protein [Candidatus Neomarinimicrobiota bacterium]